VNTFTPITNNSPIGKLAIHPTLFFNRFTIDLEFYGKATEGILELYNAQGSLVNSREVSLSNGPQSFDFENLDLLSLGAYFVTLKAGSLFITEKVVKIP
jgi:hypothetical protein